MNKKASVPEKKPVVNVLQPRTALLLAIMAAIVAFGQTINHEFVNIDDDKGILINPLLNPVTADSFLKLATTPNLGMFAPVSNILYGIVAGLFGVKPEAFHIASLFLHLINIFLVFRLIRQLFPENYFLIAFVTMVFAVHPLQSEAISWAAAMSTLLYALFYLLALNSYVRYTHQSERKYFILTICFFLLSILSKSAAVTLPLALLAIDYIQKRPIDKKIWLEKLPFFALSLGFGILTLLTRSAEGHSLALSASPYSLLDRVWMVSETLLFYATKFIVPLQLCLSYPFEKINGSWSFIYYLSPLIVVFLGWMLWKAHQSDKRMLVFGVLFFVICISVMLPYITIGNFELKSDRYNYLAIIGLSIVVGNWAEKYIQSSRWVIMGALGTFFLVLSFVRTGVWKNSITLFTDVIQKTKNQGFAYYNRGLAYYHKEQYPNAIEDFDKASNLNFSVEGTAAKKGLAYLKLNNVQKSREELQKAISEDATNVEILKNLGKANLMAGDLQNALSALNRATQLNAKDAEIFYIRGLVLANASQNKEALDDYGMAIALNTKYTEAFVNRGNVLATMGEYDKALADYNQAILLNPKMANVYNNRGNVYMRQQQWQNAVADFDKALVLNPNYSKAAASRQEALRALGK